MREALAKAGVCTSLSFDQFIQERNAVPAISAFMEKTRLLGQFHAVFLGNSATVKWSRSQT
ncbi:hypothetical protein N7513_004678 [Penicillium frequentans]|nr:hypothetical protein N7513_004678 [Penicillium glabrum]